MCVVRGCEMWWRCWGWGSKRHTFSTTKSHAASHSHSSTVGHFLYIHTVVCNVRRTRRKKELQEKGVILSVGRFSNPTIFSFVSKLQGHMSVEPWSFDAEIEVVRIMVKKPEEPFLKERRKHTRVNEWFLWIRRIYRKYCRRTFWIYDQSKYSKISESFLNYHVYITFLINASLYYLCRMLYLQVQGWLPTTWLIPALYVCSLFLYGSGKIEWPFKIIRIQSVICASIVQRKRKLHSDELLLELICSIDGIDFEKKK